MNDLARYLLDNDAVNLDGIDPEKCRDAREAMIWYACKVLAREAMPADAFSIRMLMAMACDANYLCELMVQTRH